MAEDRIKLPRLDEKTIDGKKIYNRRQWLERFNQYRKRKNEIDLGPLIKEEQMTGTDWNTQEEKTQQDFLRARGPKATPQILRSEY